MNNRSGKRCKVANRSLPKSTGKPSINIPPPQRERILQRYVTGQSIRQIAREEKRARETVTKVVRSEEMQTYVQKLRERLFGLGDSALDAVDRAIRDERDGRLAYKLLDDMGVIPAPAERVMIPAQAQVVEDSNLLRIAMQFLANIEETRRNFNFEPKDNKRLEAKGEHEEGPQKAEEVVH